MFDHLIKALILIVLSIPMFMGDLSMELSVTYK